MFLVFSEKTQMFMIAIEKKYFIHCLAHMFRVQIVRKSKMKMQS